MRLHLLPQHRVQRGFTIAELLVAVAISLMILAGMTTLFVNNTKAQGEIEKANRQVENGRYGMQLISSDLRHAGFYGEFDPTPLATPATLPQPCALEPGQLRAALPLHVQGYDNASASLSGCLSDVLDKTDVLVVRRTATCAVGQPNCDAASAGGPFFQASLCNNPSELDSPDPADFYALDSTTTTLLRHQHDCTLVAGSGSVAAVRRYLTHIYFIANNDKSGDGIPTLKRVELGSDASGLAFSTPVPLVEGIENMQLEYGIDTSGDGVADLFSADPAAGCSDDACTAQNWRNVVSVKLNLLARNTEQSRDYTDDKTYALGAVTVGPKKDHYKRHVFQALVDLPNPAGRKLP